MRDELLAYYERELTFVRRLAAEFAEKYPKIAQRLVLERDKCEDPHVERLIESFAFLAARIHLKIDDEFPEITESLLQVLYPHYLAPVPSMSIVQFRLDPDQGKLSAGYSIDKGSKLYSRPSQDTVCQFRTSYPVTLWPVRVADARFEVSAGPDSAGRSWGAVLDLELETIGDALFSELEIDSLRFFLSGENLLVYRLYEALFATCRRVELVSPGEAGPEAPVPLPEGSIGEVGFSREEGILPYSSRSFLGYRLMQEYFNFPEKFLFFDLRELAPLREARFESAVKVRFYFQDVPRLDQGVGPENFLLGCVPAVNLFHQVAEPIRLDQARTEYRVIADVRRQRSTEIYSIDSVTSVSPHTGKTEEYQPFYSFKHTFDRERLQTFWHATRRPSEKKDDAGSEVYLMLVDLDFRSSRPPTDIITVHVTGTNRDLPGMLPFGDPRGDFELAGGAPLESVRCLIKPTLSVRSPMRYRAQWRLISHLSLNYLSLVDTGEEGSPEALQEILRLYDFGESPAVRQQLSGITGVKSRQVMRRIGGRLGSGFARGIEATLEFDEGRFVGSGVYLFASVLEKFLGLYVSINSFSEMVATTKQRGVLKRWAPRSGTQILL